MKIVEGAKVELPSREVDCLVHSIDKLDTSYKDETKEKIKQLAESILSFAIEGVIWLASWNGQ